MSREEPPKRSGYYILNQDNEVVEAKNVLEWADFIEKHKGSLPIKRTDVGPKVTVSTIFTGLDFSARYTEPSFPRVFETMILGGRLDMVTWQWSSYAEALEGHGKIVKGLQSNTLESLDNLFMFG